MDQPNRIALTGAEAQEMREANEARAAFCRFLASLYLYELTDEQIEAFAHIDVAGDGTAIDEGLSTIKEYLRHRHGGTRQELAVDYARVFLGAGSYDRILAPPYESVFTSEERILMQDARDGAVTYYRRAGLDLPADNTTPEDHLGFELQFVAALAERANEALDGSDEAALAETMALARSFFAHHQQNWLPALCDAVDEFAETDFYRGVARMTRGYVESEAAFFDEVAPVLSLGDEVAEIRPAWDVDDTGALAAEGAVA
ncbi:TorD/DmsD family molecular chaperone [Adlercreutzia shanghongiae]|uniref:Molecular chaperone TorD family protein n=1 Tax=Adlercreutzia shanghongiae TaxID=3111773 RepID=A0ABU6J1S6_9ACTN|nr:molecular chaperone TorD family protein [Adlercreutzia sp. R22]MEC4295876.1 molecular chaperone TorD family protein [Adlercreutzia sp. R22]